MQVAEFPIMNLVAQTCMLNTMVPSAAQSITKMHCMWACTTALREMAQTSTKAYSKCWRILITPTQLRALSGHAAKMLCCPVNPKLSPLHQSGTRIFTEHAKTCEHIAHLTDRGVTCSDTTPNTAAYLDLAVQHRSAA